MYYGWLRTDVLLKVNEDDVLWMANQNCDIDDNTSSPLTISNTSSPLAINNISVMAYHQQYINSVSLQQYISSGFPSIIHHLY
jgi:hypothetical protein